MRRPIVIALAAAVGLAAAAGLAAAQEITTPPSKAPPASRPSAPAPASPTPAVIGPASPPEPVPASSILASGEAPAAAKPARPAPPKAPDAPKPPPEPLKRPRFNSAILQGVDKITAETLRFEAKVGEPVRYKGLILTVRACETTAADETIDDNIAFVEVQSQPEVLAGRVAAPPRQVFKGWMFASSPTLHSFEHPVYDLWLIACKTAAPGA